ncbi:Retrotransposon protein [Musa troglodytarum]|uniref:Retrotransposon protein n=1 Tax=Musa troglodytarum TaxID=320322 RepID=A0A9E7GRV5_9LILI|nr:Retrotransposon protein [Musa troglodytarum]
MASTAVERLARLFAVAGCCCLFVLAQAMDDGGGVGMRGEELLGLFEVLGALLNDPSWAQLHPRPCTETPWLGIQCEMVLGDGVQGQQQDPYLHVTKIHIGPDVASPPCKASAKLSESLLKLPYLKSLSLFGCFLIPDTVSLPPSLFADASSCLEQLVIKSNPGLSGAIPQTIGRLQNLRVLSLSQNNLHGEIPKEVGALGKLEQLDLSYNHLTGIIPVDIGGLASLSILDLSWNGLEGEIPWSVGQLRSLRKMDLSFNNISGPMPEELSDLRELQYFLVEHNPIGTSIPLFLGALKNMVVLGLSGCGLSGPIPTFFGSLANLTTISLDRNRLNGTIPAILEAIPNLGQLNLSQNQLSGEMAFSEEFVSRLGERLDVRDNQGLCINPLRHQNLSYLEAPPCVCPPIDSGERSSWPESPPPPESSAVRAWPSWSHGKGSMSLVLVTVRCLMGL